MNLPSRVIPRGTCLICPRCRKPQAIVSVDIVDADKSFDWRSIKPLKEGAIVGVSDCCLERYITFGGMFYCEFGPV